MKKFVLAAVVLVALVSGVHADLFWYNMGAISNQNGVALAADETQSSIGCFAQLIYAGANGLADSFVASGSGISGDDRVEATMFAGQGDMFYSDGFFPLQGSAAISGANPNGTYYVRVYNAPNLNFASGTNAAIPGAASYYFQSTTLAYTHSETVSEYFDFAPNGGRTLLPIPEPAMLGLGIMGLISLRFFGRKRK